MQVFMIGCTGARNPLHGPDELREHLEEVPELDA